MTAPPRRRWFRFAFSLRTMFVVVTIFGVWLGWNLKIVLERKAVLRELADLDLEVPPVALDSLIEISPFLARLLPRLDVGFARRLFGDEPYYEIFLPEEMPPQLIERVERAFPETRLSINDPTAPKGYAFRDSLYRSKPVANTGNIFKTGLIEK